MEKILSERELTIEEIREVSKQIIIHYLRYKIIGINTKNNNYVIEAKTRIGYIIKFRLNAIDDYGYNIFSPDNKYLVRFDNAPDHPSKVEFMPHHVHNDLGQEEILRNRRKNDQSLSREERKELKNHYDITDSFLSGYMGIDYLAVKNKIDSFENKNVKKTSFIQRLMQKYTKKIFFN